MLVTTVKLFFSVLCNLLKTHSSLSVFVPFRSFYSSKKRIYVYSLRSNHLNVLKISCLTIKNRQNEVIKGFVCRWFGKGPSINDVILMQETPKDDLVHKSQVPKKTLREERGSKIANFGTTSFMVGPQSP
jgi:hypothetical protein